VIDFGIDVLGKGDENGLRKFSGISEKEAECSKF
jgi:hypothetical protein